MTTLLVGGNAMRIGNGIYQRMPRKMRLVLQISTHLFQHPDSMIASGKLVCRTLLEDRFERASPIPALDKGVLDCVYRYPVVMPPLSLRRDGNQAIEGLVFLASLVRALGARQIFEIGTYNGLTAWTLAANQPDAVVHTLDLPALEATMFSLDAEAGDVANRRHFAALAHQVLPSLGTVVQHWGDSATFDFSPWFGQCDLVYVDGSHAEAYVRSDTNNALQMVSASGAIVWDDYWWRVRGVSAVLHERHDLALYRVPRTRLVVYLAPGAKELLKGASAPATRNSTDCIDAASVLLKAARAEGLPPRSLEIL